MTVNFSPALPRQVHNLVAHYTNANLPAFNMEPNASYFDQSFLRLSSMTSLGTDIGEIRC